MHLVELCTYIIQNVSKNVQTQRTPLFYSGQVCVSFGLLSMASYLQYPLTSGATLETVIQNGPYLLI